VVVRAEAVRARARGGAGAVAVLDQRVAALPAVPYRGIRPFRYVDHAIFFAREEETRRLASLVAVYRGVMLYGDSGDGKSSLINAGLLPEVMELGFRPERVRVQPRTDEELVVERIATADDDSERLPSLLAAGDDESARVVLSTEAFEQRVHDACATERPLLVFDQFEEILTLFEEPGAEEVQQRIVDLLVRLLRAPLPVKVLLAFREDYLGRVKQLLSACPELVDQALRLGPPAADALPTIIAGPFERHPGHFEREFDPQLAERLRAALEERFGTGDLSLSEVQTVCLRLWRADDPQTLLAERGVQGLLEDYLGEALDAFPPDERAAAVALLAQMVTSAGTRNVIAAEDLVARVRSEEDLSPALLGQALDRLDRESRLVRRERRRDLDLYEITSEFLVPWISQRREELRRAQERARDRRRLLVLGSIATALLLVAAGIAVIAVWAIRSQHEAQDRADEATSLALLEPAAVERDLRPDVSLLLGLAAFDASPRPEARTAAASALAVAKGEGGVAGILHGHHGVVDGVSFSPDGRMLASAGDDRTIRLWDPRSHKQIGAPLTGHEGAIHDVAFSPDGRTLASAGDDGTIRLWNVDRHAQIGKPLGRHESTVRDVAFSPDGKTLASGGDDGRIRLWDVDARRPLVMFASDAGSVTSVAFSPDGRRLASGNDNGVQLWDVRTHARIDSATFPTAASPLAVAFSPDGRTIAAGDSGGNVALWPSDANAGDKATPLELRQNDYTIESVAFSPDGRTVAAGSDENTVVLWDVRTGESMAELTGHSDSVLSVAFSPDGKTLASGSVDNTVRLWDARSPAPPVALLPAHTTAVRGVAFSSDGRTMASVGDDRAIRLWDFRSKSRIGPALTGHDDTLLAAAFDPDGGILATGGHDNTARLWDVSRRKQLGAPLEGHSDSVHGVAFSPSGDVLATAGHDTEIRLWNVATHQPLGRLVGHTDAVEAVAFSPDGRTLASAGDDATVRLWNVATHHEIAKLSGHKGVVWAVAFDPVRPDVLVSAGEDWTIRLWSVQTRKELADSPLRGHTEAVYSVAFSDDGANLASGSEDGTVRIWDVRGRPRPLVSLPNGDESAFSVAFSPDGNVLAVGSDGRFIHLWNRLVWGDFAALRKQACGLVGQDLDRSEWAQYAADVPYRESGCG
jgi:WD40 repeat protein